MREKHDALGTEKGTGTGGRVRARGNAEMLAVYLDGVELDIRRRLETPSLETPRTARDSFLRDELLEALECVAVARVELLRYPDGAPLALAVQGAHLARLGLDAEVGERAVAGTRKAGRANGRKARKKSRAHDWLQEVQSRRAGISKSATYKRIERRERLQPGTVKKAILRLTKPGDTTA